jgi:DNA polymerase-3 subunit epsilon
MRIYVLDTETTGLSGCPADLVLEVAAVEADTSSRTVRPVYSQVVGYDVSSWSDGLRGSWIFHNSDLTVEEVGEGKPMGTVAEELRILLNGRPCTSYNTGFDFDRFLLREPWSLRPVIAQDVMEAAHRVVPGDHNLGGGLTSWPKLSKAYAALCPDDPGGIGDSQRHRALEDAVMAACVLLKLSDMGAYTGQPDGDSIEPSRPAD